jgi:ACT domain-containing protein
MSEATTPSGITATGEASGRAVLTVLGSDRSGIVAALTAILAQHDVNILDISQTILQGIFTMTMLIDVAASNTAFDVLTAELEACASDLGVQVALQREEVFKFMYRL